MNHKEAIAAGKTSLGIEFGSTRIKAVLIGEDNAPLASGSHEWENQYENGVWTYSLDAIWNGLQDCYKNLAEDVKNQYGEDLTVIGSIGFSAMMHGYMAFDKNGELLVPFRTWRNTITVEYCPSLPGDFKQRGTCERRDILYHFGRIYPLENDRGESPWGGRRIRNVPNRQ